MKAIHKYWWILAFQGLFLIIAGAIAIFNQTVFIQQLVEYLALNFLGFGIIMILAALFLRKRAHNWSFIMVIGLLELAFGLLIISNTETSKEVFRYAIGGWAFLIGIIQIVIGLIRRVSFFFYLINGLISVAFGALIVWNPFETDDALTYLVAFYSVILGLMAIYYSVVLKKWSAKSLKSSQEEIEGDKEEFKPHSPSD